SDLECRFVETLIRSAGTVVSVVSSRHDVSTAFLERSTHVVAEDLGDTGVSALHRLRQYVFSTSTLPQNEMDSTLEFRSATDEARECVEIARSILTATDLGTSFDNMAILLRNPETYQPLVEDALRRAGVPAFFSHGTRRPNPAGRALLALLACASEGL